MKSAKSRWLKVVPAVSPGADAFRTRPSPVGAVALAAALAGGCGGGTAAPPEPPAVVPIATASAIGPVAGALTAPFAGVAVGASHSCAVDASRHVRCWGANDHGQLGDGTQNGSATPVTVAGLDAVIEVGAAWNRTCAVTAGGEVACWGEDDGNDTLRPEAIEGMHGAAAISVDVGRLCAVMRSGEVLCRGTAWLGDGVEQHAGNALIAEVSGVRDAVAVRGGCVLSGDGSVRCWGRNEWGSAGDGTQERRATPVRVRGIEGATAIAGTEEHACALLDSGQIACWGRVAPGDGSPSAMRLVPTILPSIEGARALAAWGGTTCAVIGAGEVACWGGSVLGSLAEGEEGEEFPAEDPRVRSMAVWRVADLGDAAAIAIDDTHACARTAAGGVACWGQNLHGELGAGTSGLTGGLANVAGITDATRVVAGEKHTCALRAGGSVMCWGDGRRGQLGDGTLRSRAAPAMVPGLEDAIDLGADEQHTCAVRRGGTVVCWGGGVPEVGVPWDQAGVRKAPAPIAGVRDAKRIGVARMRACVRIASGRVTCWGEDSFGALGVVGGAPKGHVAPVTGLAGADALTVAPWGACATTTGRGLWCWGGGAITAWAPGGGDDPSVNEADLVRPVRVKSVRDAVDVGLYGLLACALRKGGKVTCWDTEARPLAPTSAFTADDDVEGLTDAVAIAGTLVVRASGEVARIDSDMSGRKKWVVVPFAPGVHDAIGAAGGAAHVCAVRRGGEVACWGEDDAGQLGAGAAGRSERAVRVIGLP